MRGTQAASPTRSTTSSFKGQWSGTPGLFGTTLALGLVVFGAITELRGITGEHQIGGDFLGTIYQPAVAVVHGHTPYGNPRVPGPLAGSVYPPSAFVTFAWLGLLQQHVAIAIWVSLLFAAATATLWVLGVRDPRCYALWLLGPMVLSTTLTGNATIAVLFLTALVWRYRNTAVGAAASLTAAIAIKLFVAPLIVWLLCTRRYRAALYTTVAAPLVILGSWAVIGFSGLGRYRSILSANDAIFSPNGPYLQGLVQQLGGSSRVALGAGIVAAAVLLGCTWFVGDLSAFALAICASILLAPVAWIGYLALLGIPLAVRWPRLSPAWLVLLLGTYVHWYQSPVHYKSATLSELTLGLLVATAALILKSPNSADLQNDGRVAAVTA